MAFLQKEPLYVTKIDAEKNIVYVGSQEHAKIKEFEVRDLNWLIPVHQFASASGRLRRLAEESGQATSPFKATVKVRSMMKPEPATVHAAQDLKTARIVFDKSQWAPAPGQSAVFYDEDVVIGGGVIAKAGLNEALIG